MRGGRAHFAFWRVVVETTPTASGATRALAFMSTHYADPGMCVILRIDQPVPGSTDAKIVNLGWNPGDVATDTTMFPHPLPAHAMEVDGGINHQIGLAPVQFTRIFGAVATATLMPGSPAHAQLLEEIRGVTGLR